MRMSIEIISNITKFPNMPMLHTIYTNDIGSISIVTIIFIMLSKACVSMIVILPSMISSMSERTMRFHMRMRCRYMWCS